MKNYKNGFDIVDGYTGVWRTVGGRRIFIRNGESLDAAMQRSGKFKSVKSDKELLIKDLYSENPSIDINEKYVTKSHQKELKMADWIKETFHTKVTLLSESSEKGLRTPDYLLNDKVYCEFKNVSSIRSIERQIRSARDQIKKENNIVLLDITSDMELDKAVSESKRFAKMHIYFSTYFIVKKGKDYDVFYYKKIK